MWQFAVGIQDALTATRVEAETPFTVGGIGLDVYLVVDKFNGDAVHEMTRR